MTIKQKQCLLAYLGYYTGIIDGIWGPQSEEAAKRFQRDHDLDDDGVFGKQTRVAILAAVSAGEAAPEINGAEETPTGAWWKDIKYFDRSEFACPCGRCGGFPVEPDRTLVELSDTVREHFGTPFLPSSGVRCQAHNDELPGSVPNSRHVRGKAVDFCIRGKSSAQVLAYVRTLPIRYAYAIDGSYVHMDVE